MGQGPAHKEGVSRRVQGSPPEQLCQAYPCSTALFVRPLPNGVKNGDGGESEVQDQGFVQKEMRGPAGAGDHGAGDHQGEREEEDKAAASHAPGW